MTPLDFINKNQQTSGVSITDVIREHQRAGTLNKSVTFYEPTTEPGLAKKLAPVAPADESFFQRTTESVRALRDNKISFSDVVREVPGQAKKQALVISNFVAPAITNFFDKTGSIFGEGVAYAVDKNVREQYKAGNLDILPTITETTVPKLAKYTFAAGLEAAIFRSFPNVIKMNLVRKGGIGALEGIGFAISEGLAKDETPEEIIRKMPLYGVSGMTLGIVSPFLLPLLKTEVRFLPKEIRGLFKNVEEDILTQKTKQLKVTSMFPDTTAVPVSTPNKRYRSYLRSQGYEPYIPEGKLPTIDYGAPKPKLKDGLPTVSPDAQSPKVFDPAEDYAKNQGYEGYIPEKDLPVIGADGKVRESKAPPFTEVVTEPITKTTAVTEPKVQTVTERKVTPSEAPLIETPPVRKTGAVPEVKASESITVSREQLPVGSGKTMVSRLEERMTQSIESPEAKHLTGEKRATFQEMSKKTQIARDAKTAEDAGGDAIKYLTGDKPLPEGATYNGIALALSKRAEIGGDASLAVRLASLRSTRAGQEISLLTEFDPNSPVSVMETIIKARKERAVRKAKGGDVNKAVTQTKKEAVDSVRKTQLKIDEAEKLLNDILC